MSGTYNAWFIHFPFFLRSLWSGTWGLMGMWIYENGLLRKYSVFYLERYWEIVHSSRPRERSLVPTSRVISSLHTSQFSLVLLLCGASISILCQLTIMPSSCNCMEHPVLLLLRSKCQKLLPKKSKVIFWHELQYITYQNRSVVQWMLNKLGLTDYNE
jgi:hypothetical protein